MNHSNLLAPVILLFINEHYKKKQIMGKKKKKNKNKQVSKLIAN